MPGSMLPQRLRLQYDKEHEGSYGGIVPVAGGHVPPSASASLSVPTMTAHRRLRFIFSPSIASLEWRWFSAAR